LIQLTGSSTLLGILDALMTLPWLFFSMFAGVLADRYDRKRILMLTDFIRGIAVTALGIAALLGILEIWMIMAVGLVLGLCAPFFAPVITSIIPDLVPKSKLIKANSAFTVSSQSVGIIGSSLSGILLAVLGAPILFLVNGLSYLFSGFSEKFITIPKHDAESRENHFFEDFKSGVRYVYEFKGLRVQYCFILFLNFFSKIGMIQFVPLFNTMGKLGPVYYGISMSVMSVGMIVGALFVNLLKFEKVERATVYYFGVSAVAVLFVIFAMVGHFVVTGICMFFIGFFIAQNNALGAATIQANVPRNMRGKVSGFRRTMNMALLPLGAIISGFLGEVFPPKLIIAVSYGLAGVVALLLTRSESVRKMFNYDNAS